MNAATAVTSHKIPMAPNSLFTSLSDHDESLLRENIHAYSDMYMHSLDSPVLALGSQGSHQPNPSVQLPGPQQAHTHMHAWMNAQVSPVAGQALA